MSTVETHLVDHPGDRGPDEVVVVEFELPGRIAEAARDETGEIDPDAVSDRIAVRPLADGEPV